MLKFLELFFHEFFMYNYQLFILMFLIVLQSKERKYGKIIFLLSSLVINIPITIFYIVTNKLFFQLPLFNIGEWYSFAYLFIAILAALILYFSIDTTIKGAIFYTIASYIIQHLITGIIFFISVLFNISSRNLIYNSICFVVLIISYFVYRKFIYPKYDKTISEINMESSKVIIFLIIALFLINILTSWIFFSEKGELKLHPGYYLYGILCSILLLVIQFGMLDLSKKKTESTILKQLISDQKAQYFITKENLEKLNEKYHDFKYRIMDILNGSNQRNIDYAKESLKLIEEFQNNYKTDCEALNVVLNEKAPICKNKNIELTCMIDSNCISFMDQSDVYLLFGNALDNAIEYLQTIDDGNKFIFVKVSRKRNFVQILIENTFTGTLELNNGLPKTTKKDKLFHGFGTKTIKYIIEKYKGNVIFEVKDNKFSISSLIIVD